MSDVEVLLLVRAATVLVFAWSFGSKMATRDALRRSIAAFRVVPASWSRPLSTVVLTAEAAVAVLVLVGGPVLVVGFALAATLLAGFTAAIASSLARRVRVRCSCFGPSDKPVSAYDLVCNLFLMACAVGGAVLAARDGSVPDARACVLLVAVSGVLVMLVVNVETIAESLRRPL
jgi:hypothetical protein